MAAGGRLALWAAPLALVSNVFGWRAGFIGTGVITAVLSILTWLLVFDKPEQRGYPSVAEPASPQAATAKIGLWAGIRMVYAYPRFWPLAVWCFCNGSIIFSFCGLWAGPYLSDMHGLPRSTIGNILSMVAVGLVVGSPLLGYLSDKVFKSRKKVLLGCSLVTALEWVFSMSISGSYPCRCSICSFHDRHMHRGIRDFNPYSHQGAFPPGDCRHFDQLC